MPLRPRFPKQGGGILGGWFNDDEGAIAGPAGSGRSPLTGDQKRSLIFSGIADAIDSLRGGTGDLTEKMSKQYTDAYTKQKADARRDAVNKALQTAYASGDMNQVRQALLSAEPDDIAHITSALTATQPKITDVGGGGYSIDPIKGKATQIIAPLAEAPHSFRRDAVQPRYPNLGRHPRLCGSTECDL
jgi:hypothetical protein